MSTRFGPREGWLTVFFFFVLVLSVAWSIQAAEWTDGLGILQTMVLAGGLLGVILAKSRTPGRQAHLLSLLASVTLAAYLSARVLAHSSVMPLDVAVGELERQLVDWVYVLFTGGTSAGNYIFLLWLAFLMWLMSYICAWMVFRWQRAWWAFILAGAAMLLNVTYAPTSMTGYIITLLLAGLLLVVRSNLANREQEWEGARVAYDSDLSYGFVRAGLVISLVAIVLAWAAPSALASRPLQKVWDRVGEPWRRLQDQSSRIFHNLNYRNEPAFVSFGLSTRFGGAVHLSDQPIMDVKSMYSRYWRVMVFQEYSSVGWTNTDQETVMLDRGKQELAVPSFGLRLPVTQTITLMEDLTNEGTIAAAGQPLKAAIPLKARVTYLRPYEPVVPQEGSPGAGGTPTPQPGGLDSPALPGDASALYAQQPIRAGNSYQVVSSITLADEDSLRTAGTNYPDWIVPRYLQLPDSLPGRVRKLAAQVTSGRETPYDKAVAIETYLRTIPYNQQIDGPRPGQDGVDYFLFDAKQGYCDYYASAMVTMLRSLDVPARYVQGYTSGEYDNGTFHVREANSHAWPEVYFPGYGWVEFEPTASEPVIARPRSSAAPVRPTPIMDDAERLGINEGLFDRPPNTGVTPVNSESLLLRIGRWIGTVLAILAVPALAVALLLWQRRRRLNGLSLAERGYDEMVLWVRALFRLAPLAHQTPYEYAGTVNDALRTRHRAVEQVAGYYVQERFGHRAGDEAGIRQAWTEARPILWRSWLDQRLQQVRRVWRRLVPSDNVD